MFEELEKSNIKTGYKEVMKCISQNRASTIYIAEDCDEYFQNQLRDIAMAKGIKTVFVPTKKELGKACKIDVSASCAAILF